MPILQGMKLHLPYTMTSTSWGEAYHPLGANSMWAWRLDKGHVVHGYTMRWRRDENGIVIRVY